MNEIGLQSVKSPAKRMLLRYWRHRYLFLLLTPALIWYIIFRYIPLYGVQIAFKDFRLLVGIWASPWVGFDHFVFLFTASPDFGRIMFNTIWLSLLQTFFGFPAPILLALLLNELWGKKFMKVIQNISYLPHFFSWVVMSALWINMLSPSRGVINQVIMAFGGQPIFFMADQAWIRTVLVFTGIMKGVGWGSIIFIAAISGIDPEMYEAAVIDGAGRIKQAIHITIPSIMPIITIMAIMSMGGILDAGFDQILNMMTPVTRPVIDVIDTYVYRIGLERIMYSMASAVGLFKTVVSFIVILFVNFIVKKMGQPGLF